MVSEPTARPSPPLWLLAELTYECPLHCPYCSNPLDLGNKNNELTTTQWIKVIEEAREMGAVQLGFSGGEPLLRKDLEQLIAHAHQLGYYTNLITSGIGLTPKRIEKLKRAGLDHIQVSFQAADPSLNDAIAKKNNAFDHKLKMAKAIKQAGFSMVLNFVVSKQNIEQIPSIMTLACQLEADYVEMAMAQYYGWALLNRDQLLPSKQQIEKAQQQVLKLRSQPDFQGPKFILVTPDYHNDQPKACMNGWGSIFLTVTPEGNALPCHSARVLPIEFANVKQLSLKEIWHTHSSFNHFRGTHWLAEPCQSCEHKESDFGGCRCQAYLLTGDMHATDPVCTLSPHRHLIDQAITQAENSSKDLIYRNPNYLIAKQKA